MLESIDFPDAGDSAGGRAEDQGRSGKDGHGDSEAGPGRSDIPRQYGSRNRPDHSVGHGRTAPRNHRRPHDARVRRGRQRRQAAGGLPRDDPRRPRNTITRTRSRPAAAASTRARNCAWSRCPGEGFEFENEIKGGNIPKEFIPAIEKGVRRSARRRHPGGLSDGRTSR